MLKKLRNLVIPRDYWSMEDEDLEALAHKYHLATMATTESSSLGGTRLFETHFLRQDVIDSLVARDTALRTGIAALATIVSILSVLANALVFVASRF